MPLLKSIVRRASYASFVLSLAVVPVHAQYKSATLKTLSDADMKALAPTVAAIRAEPTIVTLHVGQFVELSDIHVIALDKSGKELGVLSGFDFKIPAGQAATAVPRRITGNKAGKAELTIHYPLGAWKGNAEPRPEAKVNIDVKP